MQMKKKRVRQANMELLRMVSMMGITILHILYWNDAILTESSTITGLRTAGSVLESLCVPVVATYVMISGYYDTSEEFRLSRLLRLLAEVWFYSIGLHLVLRAVGVVPPGESIWDLARYVLPVMMGHYWFVTAFVVMEILAPLLTAAAERVDRRTLRGVIGGLLVYECVLKTVLPFQLTEDGQGYDFSFFLLLFLIAAYLRRYGVPKRVSSGRGAALLYFGSCAVSAAVQIGASFLHAKTGSFSYLMNAPFHYNYLFAVTASCGLFLMFRGIRIPEGRAARLIRSLSPLTFGVYLIQCHADLLPGWPQALAGRAGISAQTTPAPVFFAWVIGCALFVYLACSAVDALRKLLFDGVEKLCRK